MIFVIAPIRLYHLFDHFEVHLFSQKSATLKQQKKACCECVFDVVLRLSERFVKSSTE